MPTSPTALLSLLVDDPACALIVTSADARVLAWNAGATHLLGLERAAAIGLPLTDLIAPELGTLQDRIDTCLATGSVQLRGTASRLGDDASLDVWLRQITHDGGPAIGRIEVTSTAGQGSTFAAILPRHPPAPETTP